MEPIETCISFLLGKAYQHVQQSSKALLAPYGVTPVQYAVLAVLWEQDAQSGAEIGERLQMDSATITGILDRLETAGLIERQSDPTDRRVNRVVLTAKASALQEPLAEVVNQINAEFFGRFAPEDAQRLRMMLAQLGHINHPA